MYISTKFCKDTYDSSKKINLHGVTRNSGRGYPESLLQEEVTNKKYQEKARGAVRSAELVSDKDCLPLVVVSVYDTKPVHFLTMVAENICWEEKEREVYDRVKGAMKDMKFHRLNVNDEYNFGMGGADIADQTRGSYRFDHWLRRYKWWHSIFWWGVQVLMVNSYMCYCTYYKMQGFEAMSHYQYQSMIACAWLEKDYFTKKMKQQQQG